MNNTHTTPEIQTANGKFSAPLVYKCARSVNDYRHTYPGQFHPQSAFFELTEGYEIILPEWNGEIGNAIPFSVYYGRDRRYHFDPNLKRACVNRIGRAILPLLERVRAGIDIVWDGNNNIAELSDDARAAEHEIRCIIEAEEANPENY